MDEPGAPFCRRPACGLHGPPPPEGGSALIRIFQRSKLRRGASHPTATAGRWGGLRIHSQDFRSQIRAFSTPQRPPLCDLP